VPLILRLAKKDDILHIFSVGLLKKNSLNLRFTN
jgi:hypothetical protein